PVITFSRVWADRRTGTDRRAEPRRRAVLGAVEERRHVVDRRRGSERRSTLDRRGRASRAPNAERPVEHVRNALQLLREVALVGELSTGPSEDLGAAIELVGRAEQRLTRYDVHVDPFLMTVPVLVLEGPLRRFVLRDFVLQWRQGVPELGVTWFRFQCIGLPCPVSHCSCADFSRFVA